MYQAWKTKVNIYQSNIYQEGYKYIFENFQIYIVSKNQKMKFKKLSVFKSTEPKNPEILEKSKI